MYTGNNVCCPCCNRCFNKFYPSGKFGSCPRCGSSARHRILYLYLTEKSNLFNDRLKLLHISPEHCFQKTFKNLKNIEYLSADLGSARAMEVMDITDIKYPADYFDVVLSNHVLEHISDDEKAMRELCRILKISGWSIHQVPIDYQREETLEDPNIKTKKDRLRLYGHHDHKRLYGKDYKDKLEKAGFFVKVDSYASGFSENDINRYGLNVNDKIYLCKKK